MLFDYYKNDLSVNDALALLLGLDFRQFRRQEIDILDVLKGEVFDCHADLEKAREAGDAVAIKDISLVEQEANQKLQRAGNLRTKLVGEIDKARKDKPTLILIVKDETWGDIEHDFVRISKQSLYDWAEHAKIKVGSAPPPTYPETHHAAAGTARRTEPGVLGRL
jgi:hypothetical protein